MKKVNSLFLLSLVVLLTCSFKGKETRDAAMPNIAENYFIKIDGYPFDAKTVNNYSVQLINNGKSMLLSFIGNDVKDKAGNLNPQRMDVQYAFTGTTGMLMPEQVSFEFDKQKFFSTKGMARVNVTKLEWSTDHKTFVMSAEFTGKVKKSSLTEDVLPVLNFRGNITNVLVQAPGVVSESLVAVNQ